MLVPIPTEEEDIETRLACLVADGIVEAPRGSRRGWRGSSRRPGALARFLAERD
jgi:hypothetical protein